MKPFGFGAKIAAMFAEEALEDLDARIKRVTAPFAPVPFNPPLEGAYYPGVAEIEGAVKFDARQALTRPCPRARSRGIGPLGT